MPKSTAGAASGATTRRCGPQQRRCRTLSMHRSGAAGRRKTGGRPAEGRRRAGGQLGGHSQKARGSGSSGGSGGGRLSSNISGIGALHKVWHAGDGRHA